MCKNVSKEQIISNIRDSRQTPEGFIPRENEIDINDWELECDDKGDIIAQGNLYSNKGDWYSCTIQKLYVHPAFRGKGIGKNIVKRLINKAKTRKDKGMDDCQILTADVDRNNVASRDLFEKMGFKIRETFCIPGENKKADVLRMSLTRLRGCGASNGI